MSVGSNPTFPAKSRYRLMDRIEDLQSSDTSSILVNGTNGRVSRCNGAPTCFENMVSIFDWLGVGSSLFRRADSQIGEGNSLQNYLLWVQVPLCSPWRVNQKGSGIVC